MSNLETVNSFIETLLRDPVNTMEAVRMRLSMTDYELVLKKANIIGELEKEWNPPAGMEEGIYSFPLNTGEKGVLVK